MQWLRTLGVLLVTLSLAWSMTLETTSPRPIPQGNNHTKENSSNTTISNKFIETNISSAPLLDIRTPPKIQNQIKDKISSKFSIEPSHAGVAIPVDEDIEVIEESTKKMNFYKLERPTTSNGGLSTWILLSGQSSSTSPTKPTTKKPSVKPIILKDEKNNETLMLSDKPIKVLKPGFKQRSTTSKPSTSSTTSRTTTVRVNTFSPSTTRKPTKLTKVKASLLAQSMKANSVVVSSTTFKAPKVSSTTELAPLVNSTLPVEAKEGDQELPPTEEKKIKTQKRKKNKNKRRKPEKASKESNDKLKEVGSAGTQLYSYLRSEIIPVTVGVSLVGLLVTAGLASYYLQPFAALRRNDPIDRKDTAGPYYYHDDYSNAVPEEEAIGKVIAGMPESSTLQGTNYKQPTSRNTYPQNVRYRHVDRRSQIYMNPYGSVEDVKLDDRGSVAKEEAVPEATPAVVPEHGPRKLQESERKFVVGNVPKEFLSVGASPRNLKRRRRQVVLVQEPDDAENEIDDALSPYGNPVFSSTVNRTTETPSSVEENNGTTEEAPKNTTPHNIFNPDERPSSFFELISDLFKMKVLLGMELLQNVTKSVSSYVSKVHTRLDEHYRRATRRNDSKAVS